MDLPAPSTPSKVMNRPAYCRGTVEVIVTRSASSAFIWPMATRARSPNHAATRLPASSIVRMPDSGVSPSMEPAT